MKIAGVPPSPAPPAPSATAGRAGRARHPLVARLARRSAIGQLGILLLLATGALLAGFLSTRVLPTLAAAEHWAADLRTALLSAPQPQHPDIVIVAITEETLATLPYRSPVDRAFLAGLVATLEQAGARAIGIDVLFDQPTEPAKDARLRETLQAARLPVVVAWAGDRDQLTPRQAAFLGSYMDGIDRGLVNLLTDAQFGTVRWIFPGRTEQGMHVPGFAPALARALGVQPPEEPVGLAYRAPPDAETPPFRTFPAHAVPLLPAAWFKDKVVLVGSDLPHTDRHRTPWAAGLGAGGGLLPGVAIHAHALAQLLDGSRPPDLGQGSQIALLAAAVLSGLGFAALRVSGAVQVGIAAAGLLLLWIGGFLLFAAAGVLLPLVESSVAFAAAWAFGNAHWRGTAWRQREFIRNAFSRFAAPAVVERLIADPSRLRLGGEKREVTSLFTDVEGFTPWFERTDPQQALAVLTAYLDGMSRVVFEHGGTIDKIIGDALHVLFGAPLDQPDQAERAVRCALAMDAFGRAFACEQREAGRTFGLTRIGVHAGPAVVGNFGGDRFFHYTAYGDTVNTAARLEGANKALGGRICVSEAVARQCPGQPFRPIGSLLLVGKERPIEAFEPVPPDSPEAADLPNYLAAFQIMRDDRMGARKAFETLSKRRPDDWLYGLHATRLAGGAGGELIVMKGK